MTFGGWKPTIAGKSVSTVRQFEGSSMGVWDAISRMCPENTLPPRSPMRPRRLSRIISRYEFTVLFRLIRSPRSERMQDLRSASSRVMRRTSASSRRQTARASATSKPSRWRRIASNPVVRSLTYSSS